MPSDRPNQSPASRPRASRSVLVTCYVLLAGVFVYVLVTRHFLPLYLAEPIYVIAASSQGPTSLPSFTPADTRVDPNTADVTELMHVQGIGEVTAKHIVEYREKHQTGTEKPVFRSADDLVRVPGIGPKTVEKLRPQMRFPGEGAVPSDRRE